ncbi:16263_t:CDS:1, partial [Acaulospora colombiana]
MNGSIQQQNQSLIAAAFTAASGAHIVTQHEYQMAQAKFINANQSQSHGFYEANVYTSHLVTGSVPNLDIRYSEIRSGTEEIIIQTAATGENPEDSSHEQFITIYISLGSTIQELKSIIRVRKSIPTTSQVELLYLGQILLDHHPLSKYIVEYTQGPRSLLSSHNFTENTAPIIKMRVLKSPSELSTGYINSSHLQPEHDRDFTAISKDKKKFFRGGKRYRQPLGWKRYALKVVDEYEDFPSEDKFEGNNNSLKNKWLGREDQRSKKHISQDDEWVVAYHGVGQYKGESMADAGYRIASKKQSNQKVNSNTRSIRLLADKLNTLSRIISSLNAEQLWFSRGVYTTPKIELAEKYATKFTHRGEKYMVLFQSRVRPETFKKVGGGFCVSPVIEDVRTYGILIKK